MLVGAIDLDITWTLQNRAVNPGIEAGDFLYLNCQGGGGSGNPILRDARAVSRDISEGLTSGAALVTFTAPFTTSFVPWELAHRRWWFSSPRETL